MKVVPLASLGVDTAPRVKVLSFAAPKARAGGGRVADVAELVSKLKNEAKVL
jgi:electron transfer flavoprotein beta subunit